jgi:hypothetical protein
MTSIKLQKITKDNYVKTGNEIQSNLTQEDIEILLEEYEEIDNINQLSPGIHIRYYTIIKKKNGDINKLFRMGGTIIKIDLDKKYIVLSNNRLTWCVQIEQTIFYKKMSIQDVKHFYENELDENEIELKKYKSYIDRLKTELKKYNEQNNSLNDENHKLKIEMKRIKKLLKDSGIVYN